MNHILMISLLAVIGRRAAAFAPRYYRHRFESFHSMMEGEVAHQRPSSLTSPLDLNNEKLTAVIIFDVENADDQNELLSDIHDFVHGTVKHQPGFVSSNLHKSFDGGKVVNYAQWLSQQDFDAFRSNSQAQEAASFLTRFDDGQIDSRTYVVFDSATNEDEPPNIHLDSIVHVAEFDFFSKDLQPKMMELAKEHLPPAMKIPGLLTATFHKSHDGGKVINYGQWANQEAINTLKQQPGFSTATAPYWHEVAVNEHHLYETLRLGGLVVSFLPCFSQRHRDRSPNRHIVTFQRVALFEDLPVIL